MLSEKNNQKIRKNDKRLNKELAIVYVLLVLLFISLMILL